MILLLTFPGDRTVGMVASRLEALGARYVRFDDHQFPEKSRLSVRYSAGRGLARELQVNGEAINLGEIRAAWDHRPGKPEPDAALPAMSRRFAATESGRFMDDVWRSLDCRWVPAHKDVVLRSQHKASQLKRAQALGFEIPPTLIANNPEEFREFHRRHGGRIVSKVFHHNMQRTENDPLEPSMFMCMTQLVSNREVAYASSIRYAPVIFQAYVPKKIELRVTVVGRRVLAAAIHSQDTHRTRHDWRHPDLEHTRYTPYALPPEIEARCLALVEQLGLCFGAIDLVLTPDGRYVFLEINPSGQWQWVETKSGLPIADALASLLIDEDREPALHD